MKKVAILALAMMFAVAGSAQGKPKADSTKPATQAPATTPLTDSTMIEINCTVAEFRGLLSTLDQNIDSKSVSKMVLDFLQKRAALKPPAVKPKEESGPPKKQ